MHPEIELAVKNTKDALYKASNTMYSKIDEHITTSFASKEDRYAARDFMIDLLADDTFVEAIGRVYEYRQFLRGWM